MVNKLYRKGKKKGAKAVDSEQGFGNVRIFVSNISLLHNSGYTKNHQ